MVPQAQITLHGNATGVTRIVTSDKDGNYTIPSIQPGDYSVEVSAAGFSRYVIKSIVLEVDQKSTINIPAHNRVHG